MTKKEYLLRRHRSLLGEQHEVLVIEEFDSTSDFLTVTIHRETRPGPPKVIGERGYLKYAPEIEAPAKGHLWHRALVRPILNANIAKYKDRRGEKWGPSFRKELKKIAKKYLNDSTYVAVIRKSTGKLVGGVRLIEAPYGKVNGKLVADGPAVFKRYGSVEGFRAEGEMPGAPGAPRPPRNIPAGDELGVEFLRPTVNLMGFEGGRLIEPGAYFIEESELTVAERARVFGELWMQIMKGIGHTGNDSLAYYGTQVITFNEKISRRFNIPLGWDYLRKYYKDGVLIEHAAEGPTPPVRLEGDDWWLLSIQPERVNTMLRHFGEGKLVHHKGENVVERRVEISEGFPSGLEGVDVLEPMIEAMKSEDDALADDGASGVFTLMQAQLIHLIQLKSETATPESRQRAASLVQFLEEAGKKIEAGLESVKEHPNFFARYRLTRIISLISKHEGVRTYLPNRALIEKFHGPMLFDPDLVVAQNAIHELRNSYFGPKLKEALQIEGEGEKERREALAFLKGQRIGEKDALRVAEHIRELLDSEVNTPPNSLGVYTQNTRPVNSVLHALLPYRDRDKAIGKHFLVLAALLDPRPYGLSPEVRTFLEKLDELMSTQY